MKQYCRYCNNLCTGNGTCCGEHQKELSGSYCKRVNTCKDFVFNPIDAFGENLNGYKPREKRQDNPLEQMTLESAT